jgi:hypothetical protein
MTLEVKPVLLIGQVSALSRIISKAFAAGLRASIKVSAPQQYVKY